MKRTSINIMLVTAVCLLNGCAAFRVSISERDPRQKDPLTANYDHSDLLTWGDMISADIVSHSLSPRKGEKAVLVPMGIQNRTRTHLDMKALSDTITTKLLDTGKVRLINAARRDDLLKEQGYQLANCSPSTRARIGRQLGANYMLTGSLIEISHSSSRQVRVSKKEDVYYQLTMEITNLETGEIELRKQIDRLRRASKPIIGW